MYTLLHNYQLHKNTSITEKKNHLKDFFKENLRAGGEKKQNIKRENSWPVLRARTTVLNSALKMSTPHIITAVPSGAVPLFWCTLFRTLVCGLGRQPRIFHSARW